MKKTEGLPVDLALLMIRLALAAVFIGHGAAKFGLLGPESGGIEKFATSLKGLGVPAPDIMAYIVAGWELGGGILLVIGLASRIAAMGLHGTMIVAFVKVHMSQGFFLPPLGKGHGYEYVMVLGVMALAIVIAGPGQLALDAVMFKKKKAGP